MKKTAVNIQATPLNALMHVEELLFRACSKKSHQANVQRPQTAFDLFVTFLVPRAVLVK